MYQNSTQKTVKILSGNVQMQILERKLQLAVEEEKYEKASLIQKEIEKLKAQ